MVVYNLLHAEGVTVKQIIRKIIRLLHFNASFNEIRLYQTIFTLSIARSELKSKPLLTKSVCIYHTLMFSECTVWSLYPANITNYKLYWEINTESNNENIIIIIINIVNKKSDQNSKKLQNDYNCVKPLDPMICF